MSALAIPVALAIALRCAPSVAPGTLLSVAMAESGLSSDAVHTNRNGTVDIGLAQINSATARRLGLSLSGLLDPCLSLAAAARVLTENWHPADSSPAAQQAALRVTLAAYNAGPNRGPNLRYVRAVEAAAAHVIPEIRLAGVGDLGRATEPVTPPPSASPPPSDVTIGPASAGREQVFSSSTIRVSQ